MDTAQLRQERLHKAEVDAQLARSDAIIQSLSKLDATTVEAFSALIQFMQGHVSKTEVVNQLRAIETPDTAKAVRQAMSSINDLHATLKKKDVDLSPLTEGLSSIFSELQKIPKELPEQKDSFHLENISELLDKFDSLENTVQKLADKELPTPEVTVKPTDVTVQPADVVVESDFTTLEKQLKDVIKAVKGIVFPDIPETDLSKVEKELKTANKHLKELTEKPFGGGGGGGGHATPYVNGEGAPTYVYENPTNSYAVSDVDESTNPKYYGFLRADGAWYIMRNTSDTTYRYASGASGYNWSNRASESYDVFSEAF